MQEKGSCVTTVVVSATAAAVLCTLMISGGWLVWIPVVLALITVSAMAKSLRRW